MPSIKESLADKGYCTNLSLFTDELQLLRGCIEKHYINVLSKEGVVNISKFEEATIKNYHSLCATMDHGKIWHKTNRILEQVAIDQIKQMSFFKRLQEEFGYFDVSDEEEVGREEFYFRLCRPNEAKDFGPLHADAWFWELGHGKMPPNAERIKVWIAIYVEKGLNGFRFVPYSHQQDIPYHGVKKEGFAHPKPQIDVDEEYLDIELFDSSSGDMIIFHDKLLHGGAENRGNHTRVSLEFTMLVSK